MKVFEALPKRLDIGQEAENFLVSSDLSLSNVKRFPIFLVFWKTL